MRTDEGCALALGAEAEILQLHHHDDGVVVVGLHNVDAIRRASGHHPKLVAVDRPTAAQLDGIVGEGVVPLDRRAEVCGMDALGPRRVFAHHEEGSAPAQGITQSNRAIGSAIIRAARYCAIERGYFIKA